MLCGYAGKMLFVDLSRNSIQETDLPEEMCRQFIGGYGFGIRVLYEQM
jgi:aldehyde:ferredoxin oxidoreductase